MAKFFARTLVSTAAALALMAGTALPAASPAKGPGGTPVSGRDWFSFGGDDDGLHYSPLGQINQANVKGLGLAWAYDIDAFDAYTQPLAVNGVLYFAAGHSVIHALDARSGQQLGQIGQNTFGQAFLQQASGHYATRPCEACHQIPAMRTE